MEETKEPPINPLCLNPIRRDDKKREPHEAVQLLVDVGAIEDSTRKTLEEYLRELESSHDGAEEAMKKNPFATARKFLLMHEQRLKAVIKAVKNVLHPPKQHGSFVNALRDVDMNEPDATDAEDDNSGDDEESMNQSPSHGDINPSPTQHIENSGIQYVQLPLPKNQGRNDLNQDRQSGGRGGNHR